MTPLAVGTAATIIGILCAVSSRTFEVNKLGVWGVEVGLARPIKWRGRPKAWLLSFPCFILALVLFGQAGVQNLAAPRWPAEFRHLDMAELQLSEIDDEMIVLVNGIEVARGKYGDVPGWVSFKEELRQGPNSVEYIIANGRYGGCGGTLTLRMNGVLDSNYRWSWFKPMQDAQVGAVCFQGVKTLNLD